MEGGNGVAMVEWVDIVVEGREQWSVIRSLGMERRIRRDAVDRLHRLSLVACLETRLPVIYIPIGIPTVSSLWYTACVTTFAVHSDYRT